MLHWLQFIATGRRTLREIVARQKHWSGCGADPFSFKAANVVRFSIQALLANPSTRTSPLVKSVFKKFGISS